MYVLRSFFCAVRLLFLYDYARFNGKTKAMVSFFEKKLCENGF